MITEEQARQMLVGPRAEALIEVVDGAITRWRSRGEILLRRTRANLLSDYMIQGAVSRFGQLPGIKTISKDSTTMFIFDDALLLKFKKHDRQSYNTRNYPTSQQKMVFQHGVFDDMPNLDLVTCGYVLDQAEASYDKIVVVRRVAGNLEWSIDLHDLAKGTLAPASPIIPGLPEELVSLPGIAQKQKEVERNE